MVRNFFGLLRVVTSPQQRIAVVGNGNIDVGKTSPTGKSPAREPGRPTMGIRSGSEASSASQIAPSNLQTTALPKNCGAMTQQSADGRHGSESAPQKFVRLVGCRDTNARPETWIRPRRAPVKQ
jgi:hypothetical protein